MILMILHLCDIFEFSVTLNCIYGQEVTVLVIHTSLM